MGTPQKSLILLAFLWTALGVASQDRDFGLGGITSGRVTSVTAEPDHGFTALYNPALIAAQTKPQFSFSTGASSASYPSFGVVRVDSPHYQTQRGDDRETEFTLPNQSYSSWAAGFSYPFSLPFFFSRRAGLGLTASGPYQKLRSISAGSPYDFSTLRYGTSDAQFKATLSGALELWPDHFFFGVGLSLYLTTAGAARASFLSNNPTGKLAIDVGFNSALLVGLFSQWENTGAGLVLRQEIHPTLEQSFEGSVQLAKDTVFRQPFTFRTSLFYEPGALEFDLQQRFLGIKGSVGVSYQNWSAYQPSSLVVSAPDADGNVRVTEVPPLALRNTWNPRISLEIPTLNNALMLSGGYQYRPTPIRDLQGASNLLDSNTHVVGLSLQYHFAENQGIGMTLPVTLGLYGQRHWMTSRQVTKAAPTFVGAPGYLFSGNAYTYGFTLQAQL